MHTIPNADIVYPEILYGLNLNVPTFNSRKIPQFFVSISTSNFYSNNRVYRLPRTCYFVIDHDYLYNTYYINKKLVFLKRLINFYIPIQYLTL